MKWQTLDSKIVYQNPWIKVREDNIIHPSGKKGIYGVVEIPTGVFVVATSENEDMILLVRQQRYCTGITSWEIPGGGLKKGKTIESQAEEELREEANAIFQSSELLGKTQTQPGITTQIDYLLLARNAKFIHAPEKEKQKEEGIDKAKFFPVEKVLSMIENGKINHGQTLTALMLFFIKKGKIKI
jgi:ADP-ribose pyrophosphatase YjhB (NUDIX family)